MTISKCAASPCDLETRSMTSALYLQRSLLPHEIGMDNKGDKRSDVRLYVLGGIAIIVALVWVVSWWV